MKTQTTQKHNQLKLNEILNEVSKYQGTLLEKILTFIEQNDLDPQEIGDILEENEQFKNIFYHDLVENNEIIDKELKASIKAVDNEIW